MALTYLDLTNKVLRRLNEVPLTSVTFPVATGFHGAAKDFVNQAIADINIVDMEWPFNKLTVSVALAANVFTFNLTPNTPGAMAAVDWESFHSFDSVSNQTITMRPMDYDEWKQRHFEQSLPLAYQGQPTRIVQVPNGFKQGFFWPATDLATYTLVRDEYTLPLPLVLHSDLTTIPDQFDYVIIERALWYSYGFRSNHELQQTAEENYKRGLTSMERYLIGRQLYVRDTRIGYGWA